MHKGCRLLHPPTPSYQSRRDQSGSETSSGIQPSMAAKYMMGNVCHVAMLKMRMKWSDRLDDGSMPSWMEKDTMRHMCTFIEGNGMVATT